MQWLNYDLRSQGELMWLIEIRVFFEQVPAESGQEDDTGAEEAIVPTDMNLLTGPLSCHGY